MCVCSWEGVVSGEELAPALSALWEVQQDSGSRQPRRGERNKRTLNGDGWCEFTSGGVTREIFSFFFFCCSTTDSHTATNRATPCCSGPKVWSQMLFEFSGGEQQGGGDGLKTTLSPNSRSTEGHFGALTIYQRQRWSVWIRPWWAKANNGCFCALHVSDWSSDKKESSAWREEGTVVTTLVKKQNPM